MPFNNDAIRAVEAGIATAADVDKAIKTGLGYKMGPLELIDLIGLDTQVRLCEAFYPITLDPRAASKELAIGLHDGVQQLRAVGSRQHLHLLHLTQILLE